MEFDLDLPQGRVAGQSGGRRHSSVVQPLQLLGRRTSACSDGQASPGVQHAESEDWCRAIAGVLHQRFTVWSRAVGVKVVW